MKYLPLILLPLLTIHLLAQTTAPKPPENPWGARSAVTPLQARITLPSPATQGGLLTPTIDLRNTSDTPLKLTNIRIWLLLSQGKDKILFTEAAPIEPSRKLDASDLRTFPFAASTLKVFNYDPNYDIKDGVPAAKNDKPLTSLGTLNQLLPTGRVRIKAFVVVTTIIKNKEFTDAIPTNTLDVSVADSDFAKLDDTAKKAAVDDILRHFKGDAVAGKSAYDKSLKIGDPLVQPIIDALSTELSEHGRMWAVSTLIDLNDKRAIPPLIKELETGGGAAYVIAYHGPRMKNADLLAAIEKCAAESKDAKLLAWAARGLGKSGKSLNAKSLETMVTQSDPAGRLEAIDILLEQKDKTTPTLLAKLINDTEPTTTAHLKLKTSSLSYR